MNDMERVTDEELAEVTKLAQQRADPLSVGAAITWAERCLAALGPTLLPRLTAEVVARRAMKIPLKIILDVFGGNAAKLYGLRVYATHNPKHDHEYEAHHRPVRAAHDGQSGVVVHHHDSHELCFDVDHGAYPFVSWELDELHVELKIEADR